MQRIQGLHWAFSQCFYNCTCQLILKYLYIYSSSTVQISRGISSENFDSLEWHTVSQMLYLLKMIECWRRAKVFITSLVSSSMSLFLFASYFSTSSPRELKLFFVVKREKSPAIYWGVRKSSFSEILEPSLSLALRIAFEIKEGSAVFPVRSTS